MPNFSKKISLYKPISLKFYTYFKNHLPFSISFHQIFSILGLFKATYRYFYHLPLHKPYKIWLFYKIPEYSLVYSFYYSSQSTRFSHKYQARRQIRRILTKKRCKMIMSPRDRRRLGEPRRSLCSNYARRAGTRPRKWRDSCERSSSIRTRSWSCRSCRRCRVGFVISIKPKNKMRKRRQRKEIRGRSALSTCSVKRRHPRISCHRTMSWQNAKKGYNS